MPDFSRELYILSNKGGPVAGVDEAGRGPLAGPVVAAAVVLDPENLPEGLDDSKKLSEARRDHLYAYIRNNAHVSIVSAPPSIIAARNIRGATLWAMTQAVKSLAVKPRSVLIDGRDVPEPLRHMGQAVIKGDSLSLSIAAASVMAKVTRDRMCAQMDVAAPAFGFAKHKGYGTRAHMNVLEDHGPCSFHRKDFAPVRQLLLPGL